MSTSRLPKLMLGLLAGVAGVQHYSTAQPRTAGGRAHARLTTVVTETFLRGRCTPPTHGPAAL